MRDPINIVENQLAAAKQEQRDRQAREADRAELRRQLSSELGRTLTMRILERAGIFRSLYYPGIRAEDLFFAMGQRNEGLALYNDIQDSCPELWPVMMKERAERRARERMLDDVDTVDR